MPIDNISEVWINELTAPLSYHVSVCRRLHRSKQAMYRCYHRFISWRATFRYYQMCWLLVTAWAELASKHRCIMPVVWWLCDGRHLRWRTGMIHVRVWLRTTWWCRPLLRPWIYFLLTAWTELASQHRSIMSLAWRRLTRRALRLFRSDDGSQCRHRLAQTVCTDLRHTMSCAQVESRRVIRRYTADCWASFPACHVMATDRFRWVDVAAYIRLTSAISCTNDWLPVVSSDVIRSSRVLWIDQTTVTTASLGL